MRYAFSTLSCPAWSAEEVVAAAARLGYAGVEWRLLDGAFIDPAVDRAKLERAVDLGRARGVASCALATSCRFNVPDARERARQVAELRAWLRLAQELGVPLVRVFGGASQADVGRVPADDEVTTWVADALREAAPAAEQAGVTIALETHDAFSSARRVAAVLDRVDSPRVAALWDSHHPHRMGESPQEVMEALGPRIAHVHVKDARRGGPDGSEWSLVLLGEGEVPVREQLALLRQRGYTGYVTVEWEKTWHPEIADPEVALPQHIAWLTAAVG